VQVRSKSDRLLEFNGKKIAASVKNLKNSLDFVLKSGNRYTLKGYPGDPDNARTFDVCIPRQTNAPSSSLINFDGTLEHGDVFCVRIDDDEYKEYYLDFMFIACVAGSGASWKVSKNI
jgi:hypothetical protein